MIATDFDLAKEPEFSLDKGVTTFRDGQLVIFDANSFGLLRQHRVEAVETIAGKASPSYQ
jgi:hypothetical protein